MLLGSALALLALVVPASADAISDWAAKAEAVATLHSVYRLKHREVDNRKRARGPVAIPRCSAATALAFTRPISQRLRGRLWV